MLCVGRATANAGALGQARSAALAALLGFRPRSTIVPGHDDTHDDFKPKYKTPAAEDVETTIKDDISTHKVFLYMKGVPEAPMCGFSNMACRILDAYGLKYGSRNVLADEGIREGIKKFTGWPTIPQVFFNGEFIGGSDILMEMHKSGDLEKAVEDLNKQG